MKKLLLLIASLLSVTTTQPLNIPSTYKAAIVEYHPVTNSNVTVRERLHQNLQNYISLLRSISSQAPDLVIFPESTLASGASETEASTEVPAPEAQVVLCNQTSGEFKHYQQFLKDLSCQAIEHNITLVVNLDEKENCTGPNFPESYCPREGFVYYNSDIVFDRDGKVTHKYRKWNLFGEMEKRRPPAVETPRIEINNITFGIFTCFDIMFRVPALNLTRDMDIKNIIFPTMWFSELPFLTAEQTQQMWAEENNVVLLASNANNPKQGSGGSGIYVGRFGTLFAETIATGGSNITVVEVPNLEVSENPKIQAALKTPEEIDVQSRKMDGFHLLKDPSMSEYAWIPLRTIQKRINTTLCEDNNGYKICCNFQIEISQNEKEDTNKSHYTYLLVVGSLARTFSGIREGGIEACAVLACQGSGPSSCGKRFPIFDQVSWPITFNSINISGIFKNDADHIQYPNSLLSSISPIPASERIWSKEEVEEGKVRRTHALIQPQNRLMTFGIYGRDFSRDTERKQDVNNGSRAVFSSVLAVFVVMLTLLN